MGGGRGCRNVWAVMVQVELETWRLYPEMFETRDAAQFAADRWPDLMKFHHKRVVSLTRRRSLLTRACPRRSRVGRAPFGIENVEIR